MNQTTKKLTIGILLSASSLSLLPECQSFTIPPIRANTNNIPSIISSSTSSTASASTTLYSSKASSRRKGSKANENSKKGFGQRQHQQHNHNHNQHHSHNHPQQQHQQPDNSLNHAATNGDSSSKSTSIYDTPTNVKLNIPLSTNSNTHAQHHLHHEQQQHQQHQHQRLHHHNPIHTNGDIHNSHNNNNNNNPKIHHQPHHTKQLQLHQTTTNPTTHHQNPMSKFFSQIIPNTNQNKEKLVSDTPEWKKLKSHAEYIQTTHLRDLLQDKERCDELYATTQDGVYLDYSRQRINLETIDLLLDLAERQNLKSKMECMVNGEKINFTEDRAVLHTALRGRRPIGNSPTRTDTDNDGDNLNTNGEKRIIVDGDDVMEEVYDVLDQIKYFTEAVRSGEIRGFTGKRLRNIISVGIGGSYLGPEFLHECLKTEPEGINASLGYTLRFLSNVDPVDVERACADLDPEETLVVIVSKTFTTAETMLNARTVRQWLWDFMGDDKEVVRKHVVAVSSISSKEKVEDFGIDTDNYFFRFWDWVGGRYSVCSAVGGIPISLLYGFDLFEKFLQGARSIDEHFINTPLKNNIPVIMGLMGIWNMSFLNYSARTTLPYAEALLKLPAHIQQLDMESNGKKATRSGLIVDYPVGEIDFGEPGTNGQHSFFQLLHMGQVVPCEFIGFLRSQHDICIDGETVSAHDELMANFFAQPDALAEGKTAEEVRAEGVDEDLIIHRTFEGNRPSLSLMAPKLTAYTCGQLLAIYEHRTAVQGFIWDINSFDQWGVELGKKLACDVKNHIVDARMNDKKIDAGNPATSRLLNYYVESSEKGPCEELWDTNPLTSVTRKTHKEHFPPVGHDLKGNDGKLKF
jgi:glucose-6-phosphate isomerase